jgi:hypothetical protein
MGAESEAVLADLCHRSFLSLWSYPNPYRSNGLQTHGEGKELCDLPVIFGQQVIIFSDKSCAFPSSSELIRALDQRSFKTPAEKRDFAKRLRFLLIAVSMRLQRGPSIPGRPEIALEASRHATIVAEFMPLYERTVREDIEASRNFILQRAAGFVLGKRGHVCCSPTCSANSMRFVTRSARMFLSKHSSGPWCREMSRYIDYRIGFGICVLERLLDEGGVLTLAMSSESVRANLVFDDYLAYRKMDEGDAGSTLARIYATSEAGKVLYEVKDSDYVAWYQSESSAVRDINTLQHFLIATVDDVVDVISLSPPKVEVRRS